MIPPAEGIDRLREGNRRFASGAASADRWRSQGRRRDTLAGQEPFAVILGCSDSRVPVEIVFDQDVGDLFVIRVAGNIVAPSQVASVEFAAERFGTRLVVVLGHTQCGAVLATLEELTRPPAGRPEHLRSIIDRIRPAVEGIAAEPPASGGEAQIRQAIRANVRASAEALRHGSAILDRLAARDGLLVVGAEYSLESGIVEFFDGAPPGGGNPSA